MTEEPTALTRLSLVSFSLPQLIDDTYVYDAVNDEYRLPKASDIPDKAFLQRLPLSTYTTTVWLETDLGYPKKVVLAKARKLINRGLVIGCICGKCAGMFELTLLGQELLNERT